MSHLPNSRKVKVRKHLKLIFPLVLNSAQRTFLFCGEKKCGKSSLILKLFDDNPKEDLPTTTALDFKYHVKTRDEKKATLNAYELGGGRLLSPLLKTCLSADRILDTTMCVCIDLSKPGNALESLMFWLQQIREHTQAVLEDLNQTNPAKIATLNTKLASVWGEHEDRGKINLCPVPIIIICTKYDIFANENEPQRKKIICRALRFMAHNSGASLVFTSVREKESHLFKSLLLTHAFEGSTPER